MLTKRHFITSSAAALFSAPLAPSLAAAATTDKSMWDAWDAQVTPAGYDPATTNPWGVAPRFLPRLVEANPGLTPGDIHVDAVARYLYHIQDNGTAMRYGVAIARGDLYEPGTYSIKRKAKWPTWTPTQNMIRRDPELYEQHADGMDAGPQNPLGSRALYLFVGNRDTYLRIHGSPNLWLRADDHGAYQRSVREREHRIARGPVPARRAGDGCDLSPDLCRHEKAARSEMLRAAFLRHDAGRD